MMKLRLTSRIVLYFVLLATLLLAAVSLLSYRSGNESLKAAAISEMLAAAIEKEAALDTWIEGRLDDIVQISSPADMAEKAANLVAAALASEAARSAHAIVLDELEPHLVGHRGAYIELFVMEPAGGKVVASTSPAEEGKFKLGHPYFDNGKTNLYLQAPYRSADMAIPVMTVAIPLRATNGRVVAVLAARLDLAAMNTIVQRRTGLRQTDDSFLFDAEQFLVTQPRFINEPVVLRRKLDTEAVRRCAARQSGVTLAPDYRGVPSIAVYRWNAKLQLGLIVKIDQAEALAAARAFGWSVFLISGLALFATVRLAFLLARTITRPLRTLHEGVRRFAGGGIREPLLESSCDEVGLLACEFNQMAARAAERTAELASVNEALKAENAERKRGEEASLASQQIIEGILNAMPMRVFWKDKNLVYLGCNAVFARDAGFADPKDVIGKDDYQMGWRDQAELYRSDDRQVIESGCSKMLIEEPQTTPEGNTITLLSSKIPLRGSNGEVSGILGMYMDITERKQAEQALRRSETKFRTLYDSTIDAVMLLDPKGFFDCNQATLAMFGCATREEFCSKHPADVSPPVQPDGTDSLTLAKQHIATAMEKGSHHFEWMHERADTGETFPAEVLLNALELDGKRVLQTVVRDITERKRAAEALRQSEEQFRAMFELASVGIAQADPHTGQWLRVNKKMCEITGYSASELLQLRVPDITHPEDRQLDREAFERVVRGEAPDYRMEKRYIRKDGALAWVNVNMTIIRDAAGQPTRTVAAIEDITERRRSEESLRLQSAALEAAANAIVIADHNGTIQLVNPAFTALTGYTAQEAVGQNPRVLRSGKQDEAFYRNLWQTISSGRVWNGELINRRKDGSFYAEQMTITPLRNADGVIARYIAIKQDITVRKELEAQMERLHTEHAVVLNSLGEGVHWVDVAGRIKYENPAAAKMLGYEASDLLGKPAHATMHHTRADGAAYPQSECPIYATLRDGVVRRVTDEVFWRKDGSSFSVEYICTPVCGQNGRSGGSVVIFTDITERKRAQAELENVHKQLLEASRRGGMAEIATNVLHNVGNVLNSVNISTTLIVQSVKKFRASSLARVVLLLQEHAHDLGKFITNDSRGKHLPAHLAQLSEHLLADQAAIVSELDSLRRNVEHIKGIVAMQQSYAKVGGVKEMINVVNLVEDSLRMNESALRRHQVEVVREFEPVPTLNVEKHKILQILVNLLRNAKLACRDSERADKRLTVRVANGDGWIRISVIDNGVGIPPEDLRRIFNHGFTTRKDGHGFGLHSGALAAKEMGGSLTVHSDGPGRGAAFMLELPGPSRDYPHD